MYTGKDDQNIPITFCNSLWSYPILPGVFPAFLLSYLFRQQVIIHQGANFCLSFPFCSFPASFDFCCVHFFILKAKEYFTM
jgi:hypothetical protein